LKTDSPRPLNLLAVVVPVYNEQLGLEQFHHRLVEVLADIQCRFRIYYIDDGSSDKTSELLRRLCAEDIQVTTVELSRNFGHQAALTAGMDIAEGDVLITLDGDGQHPPEMIPEMLDLYKTGYDIVITHRRDTDGGGIFKRWTSRGFYSLINWIGDTHVSPGSSDFRLLSRAALEALRQMPEYHRFLRGMVSWLGFRSVILPYMPGDRLAGKSKYSLRKMLGLASDAIFSFSLVPVRLALGLGVIFFALSFLEVCYVLSFWVQGLQSQLAPGWSSLMFVILFVGGVIMVSLGLMGIYIGYIFQEVKRRPVYVIRSIYRAEPAEE
jgi:glycosyltransferase involved in cell wall biosynthesis